MSLTDKLNNFEKINQAPILNNLGGSIELRVSENPCEIDIHCTGSAEGDIYLGYINEETSQLIIFDYNLLSLEDYNRIINLVYKHILASKEF